MSAPTERMVQWEERRMTETDPPLSQRLIEGADALSSRGHSPNGGENSGRVCAICDAMALLREASTTIERLRDSLRFTLPAMERAHGEPTGINCEVCDGILAARALTQEAVQPPSESQR